MTADEFEFIIAKTGAIQSEIKKDPKKKVKDVMMSSLRGNQDDSDDSSDNNDWQFEKKGVANKRVGHAPRHFYKETMLKP